MFGLQILHTERMTPRGFWLTILWIFSCGCKYERDNYGSFIMMSFGIWKLTAHFTLSMENFSEKN